jgi:hypothetical protein
MACYTVDFAFTLTFTKLHNSATTLMAIEFHTLHTAQIWHRLTSGCLQLSRNISKEFISHVQATMGKWFREQPEDFYSDGSEKLFHCYSV